MAKRIDSLGVMGGSCGCGSQTEGGKQICPSNPGKKRAIKPETEKKDENKDYENRDSRDSDES